MRELTMAEIALVTGAGDGCPSSGGDGAGADSPNELLGGISPSDVGEALIAVYEGLVMATSHVIERVAEAL